MTHTSMDEEQRDCLLHTAPLMHKVYVNFTVALDCNACPVIWQHVELCFVRSPVEAYLPMFGQALDVLKRGAIVPVGLVKLVRESG